MKKLLFIILVVSLSLTVACNNKKNSQEKEVNKEQKSHTVEEILNLSADKINQNITVIGHVTHTCKHSGRRCFIVGEDPNLSLRIEAKGITEGFKSDLIGSKIQVQGILKERQISKEYINQMEEEIEKKKVKEDGSTETCQAEMQNIQKMRDWMKANHKDYYAVYYIDGESYKSTEKN